MSWNEDYERYFFPDWDTVEDENGTIYEAVDMPNSECQGCDLQCNYPDCAMQCIPEYRGDGRQIVWRMKK